MFVTDKLGSLTVSSHVWCIILNQRDPEVLWYATNCQLYVEKFLFFDASYEAKLHNQQSEVSSVHVQPSYKSRQKRKLKQKMSNA